jgi:hypothetical protein
VSPAETRCVDVRQARQAGLGLLSDAMNAFILSQSCSKDLAGTGLERTCSIACCSWRRNCANWRQFALSSSPTLARGPDRLSSARSPG